LSLSQLLTHFSANFVNNCDMFNSVDTFEQKINTTLHFLTKSNIIYATAKQTQFINGSPRFSGGPAVRAARGRSHFCPPPPRGIVFYRPIPYRYVALA